MSRQWWEQFEKLLDERFSNLDERFDHTNKALELQAKEYSRRLDDLNHAHAEAVRLQATFVSFDKWEDKMLSEAEARKIALDRLDEKLEEGNRRLDEKLTEQGVRFTDKLDEYIKKYEIRQREIDQAMDISKGAAEEAKRISEEQGRKTRAEADAQARKTNRNMAILGVVVTVIIAAANWLGS